MANFACIDENNKVVNVIAVHNDDLLNKNGDESEQKGIDFIKSLGLTGRWLQTSFNTNGNKHSENKTPFRKNFGNIGFMYDTDNDAFVPPQPYPSWVLNFETFLWVAPKNKPDEINSYDWDEVSQNWVQSVL
jgi:hypothetical protein